MNLAEHIYSNIYAFTDVDTPVRFGIINIAGNANITISNATFNQVFTGASNVIIGFINNNLWVPQDNVLQFFHVDNVYSTLKDNPFGSKLGGILCLAPPGSTRYYQYIIKDSVLNERNNDANFLIAILGQFIEDYTISNMTISNSQIPRIGCGLYSLRNLTIDGLSYTSITNQGEFIFFAISRVATLNNITMNGIDIQISQSKLFRFTGIGTVIHLSNILIKNWDLSSSSAIQFDGTLSQIVISHVTSDSLITDTDGAVFNIEFVTILQTSSLAFTNISSSTLDSSNNYMIMIDVMDLSAAYPSTMQNVTVSNWSTGIIKIQSLSGNLTQGNMLAIQDVMVSDYNVSNSINLISLTTLTTYDLYPIIFSSMTFRNLEFMQGGNILTLNTLLVPRFKSSTVY